MDVENEAMEASIIVPCYNEEGNIGRMAKKLLELYSDDEIIVILDGCTDDSYAEVKDLKDITIINNKKRIGKASSIINSLEVANNPLIVFIDADFQYNPIDIRKLKNACENADLVVADRFAGGGPKEHFLLRILIFCFRAMHRIKIKDIQAGFKCVRSEILEGESFSSDAFLFDIEFDILFINI